MTALGLIFSFSYDGPFLMYAFFGCLFLLCFGFFAGDDVFPFGFEFYFLVFFFVLDNALVG